MFEMVTFLFRSPLFTLPGSSFNEFQESIFLTEHDTNSAHSFSVSLYQVFQLSESRLSFSDLAQLVLFYSLTR